MDTVRIRLGSMTYPKLSLEFEDLSAAAERVGMINMFNIICPARTFASAADLFARLLGATITGVAQGGL